MAEGFEKKTDSAGNEYDVVNDPSGGHSEHRAVPSKGGSQNGTDFQHTFYDNSGDQVGRITEHTGQTNFHGDVSQSSKGSDMSNDEYSN